MRKSLQKYVYTMLMAVVIMITLAACGSAGGMEMSVYESASDTASYDAGGGLYKNESAEAYPEEAVEQAEAGNVDAAVPEPEASERKLIKNVNLTVETEQFDSLLPGIERRVTELGGYVEEMSSYSRGKEYSKDFQGTKYLRYANMTVRIPRENLDVFLEEVGEQTNVTSRSESVTDVTLQYVDLESHKKALLTEQDRLLVLLEQAESVEDIVTIEGRLSEVRYQIESMEAQLRTYDNRIDYSTVYLNVDEVEPYSPAEGASTGERIRNGFLESLEGVSQGIRNAAIWFVIHIPYLVVWLAAGMIFILIVRIIVKRQMKKHAGWRAGNKKPYNPYVTDMRTSNDRKMTEDPTEPLRESRQEDHALVKEHGQREEYSSSDAE